MDFILPNAEVSDLSDKNDDLTREFLATSGGLERAVRRIVPPGDVEDVVQETYVRAYQANVSGEIRSPRSFMYRTAVNIALNHANKAETRLSESLEAIGDGRGEALFSPGSNTLERVCSLEDFAFFCEAVRSLPLQCRRAFVLKKVYGFSYSEIAQKLEISEKTVEKHISKGLVRCRSYILKKDNQDGGPA